MEYHVHLDLPHSDYDGRLFFEDEVVVGDIVHIFSPLFVFKVTHIDFEKKTIKLRFEVIFHIVDYKSVLKNLGFKEMTL